MDQEKKIVLQVTPKTKVDVTQNTFKLFNIPEVCYKGKRKNGCAEYKKTGLCKHTLSKRGRYMKKRLEKYNDYKAQLLMLAKSVDFELPKFGFSIYFFIPIPKRWSAKDRKAMHGQMHHRKPDLDNLEKALYDSLTFKDEEISQVSGHGKFWVDTKTTNKRTDPIGHGWIEIHINQPVYNPFGVEYIDQSKVLSLKQTAEYRKRKAKGSIRGYVSDGAHSTKQKKLFDKKDNIK